MPELTPSTRELARRIGVNESALRRAEASGRIARESGRLWDVEKSHRLGHRGRTGGHQTSRGGQIGE